MIYFKRKVLDFLQRRFGKYISMHYLMTLQKKLHIKDLDNCTEHEQKKLLFAIFHNTFRKFMKPDEVVRLQSSLFHRIYGPEKAREMLKDNLFKIQPITFLYFVFGENLGEVMIQAFEAKFNLKNIKNQDEQEQKRFVERVLQEIFKDFPSRFMREVLAKFELFLQTGEYSEINILAKITDEYKDKIHAGMNLVRKILNHFYKLAPSLFSEIKDRELTDMLLRIGIPKKEYPVWLFKIHNDIEIIKEHGKVSLDKTAEPVIINRYETVKKVLSSYVHEHKAEMILEEALQTLNSQYPGKDTSARRRLLIGIILKNPVIKNFSMQKRLVLEDKLKQVAV